MLEQSKTVTVRAASATYDIHIGTGLLANLGTSIAALLARPNGTLPRLFVVTSPEIWRLWSDRFLTTFATPPTVLLVPAGEQHKRLSTIERLCEEMSQTGGDRDSVLLAFGGGVIGDMTGFLAAIYMRGIRYIGIPTTLLAQVDSSLGGKTGVNLAVGKNLIGSFHHPLAVFSDTEVLSTLPAAELRAGLQEAVKSGIIRDRALFDFMDERSPLVLSGDPIALAKVITASVIVKADVVAADERENGVRMLLNLGHTLGHAIEAATGYTQLLHGEAVAWGMIAAIHIAAKRMMLSAENIARMDRVIRAYGPMRSFTADAATLVALTAKDKKHRSGARSFILPVGIGDAIVVRDVSEDELLEVAMAISSEAAAAHAS